MNPTLDTSLSELRSALACAPTPSTWGQIVSAIEAHDPGEVAPLVDYAAGHVARWSPRHQLYCFASKRWIRHLIRGEHEPTARLVRRLDLGQSGGTSMRFLSRLFEHEHLQRIRAMSVDIWQPLTGDVFAALSNRTHSGTLEQLVVGDFTRDCSRIDKRVRSTHRGQARSRGRPGPR